MDKFDDALVAVGISTAKVKEQPRRGCRWRTRLATMHKISGLEFRCVAVVGVTASAVPFEWEVTPSEIDHLQHDSDLLRERCLLFVACPRARKTLHVS